MAINQMPGVPFTIKETTIETFVSRHKEDESDETLDIRTAMPRKRELVEPADFQRVRLLHSLREMTVWFFEAKGEKNEVPRHMHVAASMKSDAFTPADLQSVAIAAVDFFSHGYGRTLLLVTPGKNGNAQQRNPKKAEQKQKSR